jgi:hypothetical protein
VYVRTTDPGREFVLELTADHASLTAVDAAPTDSTARLDLPAEALVRLIYGRLDPDHTPDGVQAEGIDLDVLRRSFPGV